MGIEVAGECVVRLSFRVSATADIIHFVLAKPCEGDAGLVIAAVEMEERGTPSGWRRLMRVPDPERPHPCIAIIEGRKAALQVFERDPFSIIGRRALEDKSWLAASHG